MAKVFRAPSFELQLDDPTSNEAATNPAPQSLQLLRVGKFHHPQYGEFEITKEMLRRMKLNFDGKVRRQDLAVDYSHESDGVAAGWITEVTLSEDESSLFISVRWTPTATQRLRDKEFRYLSADFGFEFTDNETKTNHGPTLFGAGLTNRPFIKEMDAVVELSEGKEPQMDEKDKKIQELEAQIAEMQKHKDGMDAEMGEMKKKLDEHGLAAQKAGEEKAKLEEEKKLSEKNAKFEKLLTEGRAVAAQKEAFMSGDAVKFAELAQPVKLDTKGTATEQVKPALTGDAADQVLTLAEQELEKKTVRTLSEGIQKVLKENPELRQKYENK